MPYWGCSIDVLSADAEPTTEGGCGYGTVFAQMLHRDDAASACGAAFSALGTSVMDAAMLAIDRRIRHLSPVKAAPGSAVLCIVTPLACLLFH